MVYQRIHPPKRNDHLLLSVHALFPTFMYTAPFQPRQFYDAILGMNRTIFTSVRVTEMGNAPEEGILFKCTIEMI